MEREDFTKTLVFDVAGSHLPDRSVGAKPDEVGGNAEHVGEGGERLVGEFDEGFLEDGVGFPDKAAIAFEVMGKMLTDLLLHFRLVAGVFEGLAVMPGDSIERFAGNDVDVVGSFFARESEQFIEEERGGEDGGAGVVGESLVTKNGGAATRLFQGLEQGDVVAAGLEADGGGESAEAGADDEGGGFQAGPPKLAKSSRSSTSNQVVMSSRSLPAPD